MKVGSYLAFWRIALCLNLLGACALAQALHIVEATNAPPGGLAPSNTPQIVLLTFDDSVTTNMFNRVQQVGPINPLFYRVKGTLF